MKVMKVAIKKISSGAQLRRGRGGGGEITRLNNFVLTQMVNKLIN
jgi:hypothetical protein